MKDRDKLIELLTGHYMNTMAEVNEVADHLLANGVIVPPCKVGDKVWVIARNRETLEWYIWEKEVYSIGAYKESTHIYVTPICSFVESEIGVRLFLTKEEAEEKLRELKNGN